jgi:hypothetical protein
MDLDPKNKLKRKTKMGDSIVPKQKPLIMTRENNKTR